MWISHYTPRWVRFCLHKHWKTNATDRTRNIQQKLPRSPDLSPLSQRCGCRRCQAEATRAHGSVSQRSLHTPRSDTPRGLQRAPHPMGWKRDVAWCLHTHLIGWMVVFPWQLVKGGHRSQKKEKKKKDPSPSHVTAWELQGGRQCLQQETHWDTQGCPPRWHPGIRLCCGGEAERASGNVVRQELCRLLPKER